LQFVLGHQWKRELAQVISSCQVSAMQRSQRACRVPDGREVAVDERVVDECGQISAGSGL
jgi:hypothetical protein